MILNQTRQELDFLFSHRHLLSDQEAIDLAKCLEILGPEIEEEDSRVEAEKLKRSLKYFFMKAWPHIEDRKLVMGWHIEMICDYLQALETGHVLPDGSKMTDLLINIPPGFSKSVCVSVVWPAWVWARNPGATFFGVSYSDKISKRDSQKTRKLMRSSWYQRYFDIQIVTDTAEYFSTTGGGWRWASTPGGFGTGEHFDHLIIDDPLNAKKAESKAERDFVNNDWWDLTMSTRGLGLGRKTVGVMQRFHKNDWAGHFLNTTKNAVHLCLPMRFDTNKNGEPRTKDVGLGVDPRKNPGDLLDPVRYPDAAVSAVERQMGTYGTAGQFQQRPTSRDGAIFKTGNIQYVDIDAVPVESMTRFVRGWDRAGTKNAGDYSVGVLLGLYERKGEASRVYVMHVVRGQWSGAEVQKLIKSYSSIDDAKYGSKSSTWIEQEPTASGKMVAEATMTELIGHRVRCEKPTGNKTVRAEPFSIAMENHQVYVVNAAWTLEYVDELAIFNKGDNDDQVDASSLAFLKLTRPGFYDLPDNAEDDAEDAYETYGVCRNTLCDRLARSDDPYCCNCCKVLATTGQDIRQIPDAHEQSCTHSHAVLSRSGDWVPSGSVK